MELLMSSIILEKKLRQNRKSIFQQKTLLSSQIIVICKALGF